MQDLAVTVLVTATLISVLPLDHTPAAGMARDMRPSEHKEHTICTMTSTEKMGSKYSIVRVHSSQSIKTSSASRRALTPQTGRRRLFMDSSLLIDPNRILPPNAGVS